MFDFHTIQELDLIAIPDNGVDEKGITYQVIKKGEEPHAFGGSVFFLQLRKISQTRGFEKAELLYNEAGAARIIYGEKRLTHTNVKNCTGSKLCSPGQFTIQIGRFISK